MKEVEKVLEEIKKFPLFIVDQTGTVEDIRKTILTHIANRQRNIIVTLDHTLLVKPEEGDDEKITIDKLMHMLVSLKKLLASLGIK